jgi:D-aminopeptidase
MHISSFYRGSLALLATLFLTQFAMAGDHVRARDLGVPFVGKPGALNAITDVPGVEVGHSTIIRGQPGGDEAVVRTGVTAILPRGKSDFMEGVFAGWFTQNGNGEMTGTTWVEESGLMYGAVMITNTHSVGVVRDSVIAWTVNHYDTDEGDWWSLPVVGETWDGWLNDLNGFHVKPEHVFSALETASTGPVAEGGVGGGTGMICYEFKGGIGTSSRVVHDESGDYTVGALVQANFGSRYQLTVAGVPVGLEIPELPAYASLKPNKVDRDMGSIIVVVATDAPLLPHQLKRIARRVSMGVARTGGMASNSSGDIFIAFSTANKQAAATSGLPTASMLPNERITPFFEATVLATEEAIINALVAAQTMVGYDGHRVIELPHDRLQETLKKYNRLELPTQ